MKSILVSILVLSSLFLKAQPYIVVLGIAQDGGFPHIGCQNECQLAHKNPELQRYVVSLALVDPESGKWWLFEATPDMDRQLQLFRGLTNAKFNYLPEGIFLSHAHMGHYTGLMFLGREALGSQKVKVYCAPKMAQFLRENGPWSQLVKLQNIEIRQITEHSEVLLGATSIVRPFPVPHRDEFSETMGFNISTINKSYLFIPDIDKWSKWEKNIVEEVKEVDYAFLDASFFEDGELPNRSISEVPHPFVSETMDLFSHEQDSVKAKVHFIHFNHTNPILFDEGKRKEVIRRGFKIAEQGAFY
ncbi:MAG: MBL fold metallo-hydrolase [Cyclobacteriaceae bacterium]